MDKLIIGILAAALVGVLLFISAIMGTVFGSIGGYFVGWLFDETSIKALTFFGIETFEMWEVGAILGFFGSFFKSSLNTK